MPLRPPAQRLAISAGHHPLIVGALGTLVTSITLAVSMLTLWASREMTIEHAHDTSKNVAAVLASHISRAVESTDQSLQTLIGALDKPGTHNLGPQVRYDLLFSPTISTRYVTGMGVTDDKGQLVGGHCSLTHRWDFGNRDYFIVHRDHTNVGLYVSGVYKARSRAGVEVIALSRRMGRRDGTFAGTALMAINFDYFKQSLGKLDVGPRGITAIVRTDGTLLARNPPPSVARAPDPNKLLTFPRMASQEFDFYVAPSSSDGVLRPYTFQRVPSTPFVAVTAPAINDVLASWQRLSWIVELLSLSINFAFYVDAQPLAFALRGCVMAENHLHGLTRTDPFTGLKNRRIPDVVLENEQDRLRRNDNRLSVLLIDTDHSKHYNDAHGHTRGDVALQYLAQCISKRARRRDDLVARYGGEEFMVLLSDTGEAGAARITEAVRTKVKGAGTCVPDAGVAPFAVSVGCATARRASLPSRNTLTKATDDAPYETKRKGRNRVDYAVITQSYVSADPGLQIKQSRKLAITDVDRRLVRTARVKASNRAGHATGYRKRVTP